MDMPELIKLAEKTGFMECASLLRAEIGRHQVREHNPMLYALGFRRPGTADRIAAALDAAVSKKLGIIR